MGTGQGEVWLDSLLRCLDDDMEISSQEVSPITNYQLPRSCSAALIVSNAPPSAAFPSSTLPKVRLWIGQMSPFARRVLDDLQSFAKKQGAIFLKLDPDVVLGRGVPAAWMKSQKTADRL
jgi:hypothetical protein